MVAIRLHQRDPNAAEIRRHQQPSPSERSTFLQETREGAGDGVAAILVFIPSLAVGLGTGLYTMDWVWGTIAWIAAFLLSALGNWVLANRLGWRRIRWMSILDMLFTALTALLDCLSF